MIGVNAQRRQYWITCSAHGTVPMWPGSMGGALGSPTGLCSVGRCDKLTGQQPLREITITLGAAKGRYSEHCDARCTNGKKHCGCRCLGACHGMGNCDPSRHPTQE